MHIILIYIKKTVPGIYRVYVLVCNVFVGVDKKGSAVQNKNIKSLPSGSEEGGK